MPSSYFARGIPMLPVADVRRAIDFYVDVLDFKFGFNAGGYGGVRRDAIEIHFWRTDAPAPARNASCRIEVTEIRQLYGTCRERGVVHADGDIAATPWGTTEFRVRDLDGNELTFVEVFGLGS
ncbi:MAG TPA: VOC family protein [Gemmatimonadaceae bacterium]|nr:VOC family protein [Gemmatimonadaceae bacterium]